MQSANKRAEKMSGTLARRIAPRQIGLVLLIAIGSLFYLPVILNRLVSKNDRYIMNVEYEAEKKPALSHLPVLYKLNTGTKPCQPLDKTCDDSVASQYVNEPFTDWPTDKPRGVIYYLVKDNRKITNSIRTLYDNFLQKFSYPIIIFHENNYPRKQLDLSFCKGCEIFYHLVSFATPPFLNSRIPQKTRCGNQSLGYRHMCRYILKAGPLTTDDEDLGPVTLLVPELQKLRFVIMSSVDRPVVPMTCLKCTWFHAKLVYELQVFESVEYGWRLDDDSIIRTPIVQDIFKLMRTQGYDYGYVTTVTEDKNCIIGLWSSARQYLMDNPGLSTGLSDWHDITVFYNNFEISSVSLWRSEQYRNFVDYLDHLGGIYYYRWGDAPIKTLAVKFFVPAEKIHRFRNIGYSHKHINCIKDQ